MGFEFWYTLSVIVVLSIVLVKEWTKTEIAVFGALMMLLVGGIITSEEAFHGFSNSGVLSIAILFVVAGALADTGALSLLNDLIFGNKKESYVKSLTKIIFPITALSAFTNNTPIVALYIPLVRQWAEKHGLASSRFLIPISYAAILGGMCTLIGTSTNLIVHGLLIDHGFEGYGFFEISRIGIPAALAGLIYLLLFSKRLLPDRKEPGKAFGESVREYVCELKVTEDYKNVGKTVEEAGMRHLEGLFLFQIERGGEIIAPARPDERIKVGDRLFFTGLPKTILQLQKVEGLQLVKELDFDLKHYDSDKYQTFEVVVSPSSPLVGKKIKDSNFRSLYNAVIIAIHRAGHPLRKKIGDVILLPGDTLLLVASRDFARYYNSTDFYLISHLPGVSSKARWQARTALVIFAAMIIATITGLLPLLAAAGLAAILLVLFRCISLDRVKQIIDLRVLVIIASAFGIARAIAVSGVADFFAAQIAHLSNAHGQLAALIGIYLLTSLYNTIITSNATAALIFPIAVSTAAALSADVRPFALAVTISAAASFATPISYQTNLMVYGPGGYKFTDFMKIGIPLQLLVGVIAVTLIYGIYF